MRVLRLLAGIVLLVSAFIHRDTLVGAFGLFFIFQGIFNFNTCGMGGCYTNSCATYKPKDSNLEKDELVVEVIE